MGRGALLFKGDSKTKKKNSKSKHTPKTTPDVHCTLSIGEGNTTSAVSASSSTSTTVTKQELSRSSINGEDEPTPAASTPNIVTGTGKITSSGTVVTGYGTRFTKEIGVGDALLVSMTDKKGQQQQEMRVITMRLSDVSLNLSSSFSESIRQPTEFQYIPKPRNVVKESRMAKERAVQSKHEEAILAFGTYGSTNTEELVYREKTEHGSYRIKRVQVQGSGKVTRGDLLDLRSKKKHDKYC
uniref:Uncharacterized protein n=1 Tax=Phaeodactylum tricornutum TaxID=2850 RepID=A0A8J9X7Q1_PHATR